MKKLFSWVLVMVLVTSVVALVGCNGLWGFEDDDDVAMSSSLTISRKNKITVDSINAALRPVLASGTAFDFSGFGAEAFRQDTDVTGGLIDVSVATATVDAAGSFTISFVGTAGSYYVKVGTGTTWLYYYYGQVAAANASVDTVLPVTEETTAQGLIILADKTAGVVTTVENVPANEVAAVKTLVETALVAGTDLSTIVVGVELNKSTASVVVGQTEALTATVLPSTATNKNVTWASSNTSVATVSNAGLVTAVAVGTANITATTAQGSFVATCAVTVTPIRVASVSVAPTTLALLTGATGNLTATVLPANAADKTVAWSSSNTAVATVNNTGVVTAVAPGTANITVTTTDGSKTAVCVVTVTAAPVAATGVTVNPTTLALTLGGGTGTIVATVAPANATNKNVTWTSSAPGVATVNAGVVTPVAVGNTTITATTADGGFTATCQVTVAAAPAQDQTTVTFNNTVTGLSIADLKIYITAGTSATFNASTFTTSTVVVAGSNRDIVKDATESNATQVVLMFNGVAFDIINDFNSLTFTTAIPGGCVVKIMNPAGDTLATSNNL